MSLDRKHLIFLAQTSSGTMIVRDKRDCMLTITLTMQGPEYKMRKPSIFLTDILRGSLPLVNAIKKLLSTTLCYNGGKCRTFASKIYQSRSFRGNNYIQLQHLMNMALKKIICFHFYKHFPYILKVIGIKKKQFPLALLYFVMH